MQTFSLYLRISNVFDFFFQKIRTSLERLILKKCFVKNLTKKLKFSSFDRERLEGEGVNYKHDNYKIKNSLKYVTCIKLLVVENQMGHRFSFFQYFKK